MSTTSLKFPTGVDRSVWPGRPSTVMVGESPVRGTFDSKSPANVAFRAGDSAYRIARLFGVPLYVLEKRITMVNLARVPGAWSAIDAAFAAWTLMEISAPRPFVLCGRRVAAAFGLGRQDYFEWVIDARRRHRLVAVPHPSGKSHWWNERRNRHLAQEFFRGLARLEGLGGQDGRSR